MAMTSRAWCCDQVAHALNLPKTALSVPAESLGACRPQSPSKDNVRGFVVRSLDLREREACVVRLQSPLENFIGERRVRNIKRAFAGLFMSLLVQSGAQAQVYVLDEIDYGGSVAEYSESGELLRSRVLSNLGNPTALVASGDKLFVLDYYAGTVGEYTTKGDVINAALITGLTAPRAIAVSDSNIYVGSGMMTGQGVVSKYSLSGDVENAALVKNFGVVTAVAVVNGTLLVADGLSSNVSQYSDSGTLLNAAFIADTHGAAGFSMIGGDVFVLDNNGNYFGGGVGEYAQSGESVNSELVTGLMYPCCFAAIGDKLLIGDRSSGLISEYSSSGVLINRQFAPVGSYLTGIAVSVPESGTFAMLLLGLFFIVGVCRVRQP